MLGIHLPCHGILSWCVVNGAFITDSSEGAACVLIGSIKFSGLFFFFLVILKDLRTRWYCACVDKAELVYPPPPTKCLTLCLKLIIYCKLRRRLPEGGWGSQRTAESLRWVVVILKSYRSYQGCKPPSRGKLKVSSASKESGSVLPQRETTEGRHLTLISRRAPPSLLSFSWFIWPH